MAGYYNLPAENQEWRLMNQEDQDSASDQATDEKPAVEHSEYVAPRTPVEDLIAGIISSHLNVSTLGVYDNLQFLNYTPQVAAQLTQWLQQIFRVDVPAERLLLCVTIDSVVNLLSELWGGREIVDEIAWTFLQIEQLSDEEVQARLTIESSTAQAVLEDLDQEQVD